MLRKRVCASVLLRDNRVVQSIGFKKYLPVGSPEITVEFFSKWGADEIFLLDISATRSNGVPNFALVSEISKKCFVPLAVGGGLTSVEQARFMICSGADKVVFNHAILNDLGVVESTARVLGSQSVVASIDAVMTASGKYEVFSYVAGKAIDLCPLVLAKQVEKAGVGEIIINSVDRDGMKLGFDVELVRQMTGAVSVPVIAMGGPGNPGHLKAVFDLGKPDAVAVGNCLHFSEHSMITFKQFLVQNGIQVRMDSEAKYSDFNFTDDGTPEKLDDEALYHMSFTYVPRETF